MATELRQRNTAAKSKEPKTEDNFEQGHPGGEIKHGGGIQILRLLAIIVYLFSLCLTYVFSLRPARTKLTRLGFLRHSS